MFSSFLRMMIVTRKRERKAEKERKLSVQCRNMCHGPLMQYRPSIDLLNSGDRHVNPSSHTGLYVYSRQIVLSDCLALGRRKSSIALSSEKGYISLRDLNQLFSVSLCVLYCTVREKGRENDAHIDEKRAHEQQRALSVRHCGFGRSVANRPFNRYSFIAGLTDYM